MAVSLKVEVVVWVYLDRCTTKTWKILDDDQLGQP